MHLETLNQHIDRRVRETGAPTMRPRALNHLCTRALAARLVEPSAIRKPYRKVRDPKRVELEMERLWQRYPRRVSATLEAYLAGKLAEAGSRC